MFSAMPVTLQGLQAEEVRRVNQYLLPAVTQERAELVASFPILDFDAQRGLLKAEATTRAWQMASTIPGLVPAGKPTLTFTETDITFSAPVLVPVGTGAARIEEKQ